MSLGTHHIDISVETIASNLEAVRQKRQVEKGAGNGINGGDTPKINWVELADYIRSSASSEEEEAFLAKVEAQELITKQDVQSISSNRTIINGVLSHMTKSIVYLYRGTSSVIDDYLDADEDSYIDYG
jgi:hypothetical protein